MLPKYYEFLNSVKILSGQNALENISYEFKMLGSKKPLLISDSVLKKFGAVDTVKEAVGESVDLSVDFYDVPPDSSIVVVNKLKEIYKENGCDGILAIGGGSVIDTSKGLRMLLSQNVDDILSLAGSEIMKKGEKIPFIVVPTTSGTGSEATLVAVISNPEKGVKMEFISYELLPDVAVLDGRMTETLPPKTTASTGLDAMAHAIEAYSCLQKNPVSDAYAICALRLIGEYLPKAAANGKDRDARLAMANASLMAGVAFSNSMVGLVHAIGHAAGGVAHIPHGDAMTILLPFVMEYNLEKCREVYSDILLYLAGPEVYAATPTEARAEKTIEVIRNMSSKLHDETGLPIKLSQARGVTEDMLPAIAEKAINDGAIITNPVAASKDDVLEILKKAF